MSGLAPGAAPPPAAKPTVSIIVPCRNEGAYIGPCIESILGSDYPLERLELLVVDGASDDDTRAVVTSYAQEHSNVRLLDNPRQITPTGLNIGIAQARGDVIMRMDAHALYPATYVSALVRALAESEADNVGGIIVTRPARDTPMARAIALGLSHPLGVGNSYFRIGSPVARWVDTVPFGCYRRDVFDRVGLFDEELIRNQDDEFNHRLIRRGGRIRLVPEIASYYYARDSLQKLWRMYFQYGYFKPLVVRKVGGVLTLRQLIPALFVLGLVVTGSLAPWSGLMAVAGAVVALAYVGAVLACCAAAGRQAGLRVGAALALVFPVLHLSYGLGFLKGMLDFFLLARRSPNIAAVPGTR